MSDTEELEHLRRKVAEYEAAFKGDLPPSLRFVLDVEAARVVDPLLADLERLRRLDLSLRRIVPALPDHYLTVGKPIRFRYRNHRGEESIRKVIPRKLKYEASQWHTEEEWVLTAYDCYKGAVRTFAVADILEWMEEKRT